MKTLASIGSFLRRDTRGAVAVETAIVAPLLILMSAGSFEVSEMVARQHELQGGAAEATAVALAANQGTEEVYLTEIKAMLMDSLELDEDQVTVTKLWRCDSASTYVTEASQCDGADDDQRKWRRKRVSAYVKIELQDSWTPTWSKIGLGGSFNYEVDRTIQVS